MAHFAKIGKGNIVVNVEVVNNNVLMKDGKEDEATGVAFLQNLYGNRDTYIQTSYNGTFRKNFAGINDTYDQTRDAFISPQPFPSWALNDDTCRWESPKDYPSDGKEYYWDEASTTWKEVE